MANNNDALKTAVLVGNCVLSCVSEDHNLISTIEDDLSSAFLLSDQANLWRVAVELHAEGLPLDGAAWPIRAKVDPAYIGQLVACGALPQLFQKYVTELRKLARGRRKETLLEEATKAGDARLLEIATVLQKLLTEGDCASWNDLFHSYIDIVNAPSLRFSIEGFLADEGITLIGGLPESGKTWCMLAMVRALLEGGKLFDHFNVTAKSDRIIYLIPESGLGPFAHRLKIFHLEEHVRAGRLLCRTLSASGHLFLDDPRLLHAANGAHVFLDTATRFMNGAEDAENSRIFAENLFALLRAGARTVCGAHHSPKYFGKDVFMTLENVLRGSGDIGAMLSTCWGLSKIDANSNRIFVQNVKARDFLPCEPFIIQGRPSIDERGYFDLTEPPGFAGELSQHKFPQKKAGRPAMANQQEKIRRAQELKAEGGSLRSIAKELDVSKSLVEKWLSTNVSGQFKDSGESWTGENTP